MAVESERVPLLSNNPMPETDFRLAAWQLELKDNPFGDDVSRLVGAEREVSVTVNMDTSLRPKVLDACGMTCVFCHNEGTPVASDNKNRIIFLGSVGISGRVSVFSEANGVDFLPGKMMPDENFKSSLAVLKEGLGLNEMHMTGGEPTLHPELPQLISVAADQGYSVKMTSNGENGVRMIPACAEAGLKKVNFSIFGTTPNELAAVQHARYRNPNLAAAKIKALHRSIATAVEYNVEVGANIVMSDISHADRVRRVLDEFEPKLSLRILPDLDLGAESHFAIYKFLADLGAKAMDASVDAGSSNARVRYQLPDGREVYFKQIRPARMPETCGSCELNNSDDCKEGYYGVRLYTDQVGDYKVGVCLQRMDLTMPIDEFIGSSVYNDVRKMREKEYEQLSNYYNNRGKDS
ncbi:MAG TPA: radical SAM protein [Candidatus Saccharimonadales bacterium]|nr:radical SAM protein [Candidatus Saccharimonadales bacterium]